MSALAVLTRPGIRPGRSGAYLSNNNTCSFSISNRCVSPEFLKMGFQEKVGFNHRHDKFPLSSIAAKQPLINSTASTSAGIVLCDRAIQPDFLSCWTDQCCLDEFARRDTPGTIFPLKTKAPGRCLGSGTIS